VWVLARMERRTIGILAAVALVAVAGCSGLTGSDDPTETEGPTDEMTDTTTDAPAENSTSLADVSYPAGASDDGFDNASAVAAGHADALAESDYAVSLSQRTTDGNRSEELRYVVRSDLDGQRMLGTLETSGYRNQWFGNETHRHSNVTSNGESALQVQERATEFSETHRQETLSPTVRSVLASGNFTATEVVERDGETAVRYELEEYDASRSGSFEADSASGSVLVGESGVVYEATLDVNGTSDGSAVSLELTYEVTATGVVSVDRPAWADEA